MGDGAPTQHLAESLGGTAAERAAALAEIGSTLRDLRPPPTRPGGGAARLGVGGLLLLCCSAAAA